MSDDLLNRIRQAQEKATINAIRNGGNIQMERILAGEAVVIEDLRRKEAIAAAENANAFNVVPFKK